jgi:hypothetical protein
LPDWRGSIEMIPCIDEDRFCLRRLDFLIVFLCHFFNYSAIVVLVIFVYFRYCLISDWLLDGNFFSLLSKLVNREGRRKPRVFSPIVSISLCNTNGK